MDLLDQKEKHLPYQPLRCCPSFPPAHRLQQEWPGLWAGQGRSIYSFNLIFYSEKYSHKKHFPWNLSVISDLKVRCSHMPCQSQTTDRRIESCAGSLEYSSKGKKYIPIVLIIPGDSETMRLIYSLPGGYTCSSKGTKVYKDQGQNWSEPELT